MTNAVMKRVCNRKSYRESRELRGCRSVLLRGIGGTLQKMAYWAVWMSI